MARAAEPESGRFPRKILEAVLSIYHSKRSHRWHCPRCGSAHVTANRGLQRSQSGCTSARRRKGIAPDAVPGNPSAHRERLRAPAADGATVT